MNAQTPLIDIHPDHWAIVRRILQKHVPQYAIWAFGSRAKWSAKEYSDLDLAIITDKPLPLSVSAALEEDFSESDLPWKVDVVDWATTSDAFRKVIENTKVVVQGEKKCCEQTNDWTEDRFGHLVQFVSEKLRAQDASIGTYISTENMLTNFGGITSASTLPLSGSITRFKAGDTLFSNIRTYFKKVWQAQFDGCCSNDVLVFRSANIETLLPNYLHQICRWEKFTELSIRTSKGAKMPRGDKTALANFTFKLPPIEEQRAIAHILGTLDDKIELNRKQNETLEATAQAIFKAWFVDFEPVRAKMEGRWQRGQSLPGLPAHLYDLFPDRLVESELGEIPEGWPVGVYSDTVEIIGGGTPKTSVDEYWNGEIPWFSVVDTPASGDVFVVSTEKSITQAGFKNSAVKMIERGVTIISARGTVGNLAIAGRDMTFNQSCYALRGKNGFGSYFVFLSAQYMVEQLKAMAHGSVFSTITRQTFDAIKMALPPKEVLIQSEKRIANLFEATLGNVSESRTLAQLRDTLLPKLISGELRIQNIRTVEKNSQKGIFHAV